MTAGVLFVISAASGTGKTSLLKAVYEQSDVTIHISHTTRPMREGEQPGVHYHFVSDDTFQAMIRANAFVEHATVFGYRYGTARQSVEDELRAGKNIVLEIDYQGGMFIKQHFPHCVSIFLLPPTRNSLEKRLQGRNDRTSNVMLRLQKQQLEMQQSTRYDYIVINDDFETATNDVLSIIRSENLRTERQKHRHELLLRNLLTNNLNPSG